MPNTARYTICTSHRGDFWDINFDYLELLTFDSLMQIQTVTVDVDP